MCDLMEGRDSTARKSSKDCEGREEGGGLLFELSYFHASSAAAGRREGGHESGTVQREERAILPFPPVSLFPADKSFCLHLSLCLSRQRHLRRLLPLFIQILLGTPSYEGDRSVGRWRVP